MKVALAAGLVLTALPLAAESLRFSVEKEDVISSEWNLTSRREVSFAELEIMGETQDVGGSSSMTSEIHLELIDSFTSVTAEGAPLGLSRSYEDLSSEETREGLEDKDVVSLEDDGESDLTGATVEFTFNPDTEEWSAAFAEDSDGDDEWLEGLKPRVDLHGVLSGSPEGGELDVGDTWEVPASFLADVLRPGGEVMVMEDPDAGDLPEGGIAITLPGSGSITRFDELEGDLTATLEEITEEGGERLARIVIAVDVSGELDILEDLEAAADDRGSEESYSDATLQRDLKGQLTILWNLKTHRPHAVEGELTGSSELRVEWTMSSGDFELELGFEEEADVTLTVEATFGD